MKWNIPPRFEYLIPIANKYGNYGAFANVERMIESLTSEDLAELTNAWTELVDKGDLDAFKHWLSTMGAVVSARGGGWQMAQMFALYRRLSEHGVQLEGGGPDG